MKRLSKAKRIIATLMTAVLICLIPGGRTLKVSAEEPVTFAVGYVESERAWRYQAYTSIFDPSKNYRELYYLRRAIKEGDYVVVYNTASSAAPLDLGTTPLGNLTVKEAKTFTSIFSGDIKDCYILNDSSCSINANVANAYVYGSSLCNFNYNVEELRLMGSDNGLNCTVGCSGTVNHLYATTTEGSRTFYDLYDFDKDTLSVVNGILQTSNLNYYYAPKMEITSENFDYERYANDYPDLKAVFGYDATALYSHYILCGINEGRIAHTIHLDFDYERYANDYPDLKAAFGYNSEALYNHYITLGMAENRVAYDTSNRIFRY